MAEDSAFWSWTCLNAALVGFAVFPLGLINGEFEGLLPEDPYQEVQSLLCCKGVYLNSVCIAVDQWWRTQCFRAGPA